MFFVSFASRARQGAGLLILGCAFVAMSSDALAIHPLGGCASGNCGAGGDENFCNLPVPGYPVPYATPRPTVPTNLTYGPFMPHNSLPNYRGTYLIPNDCGPGGTQVHWRAQTGINALKRIHHAFEWAR